jgi:WD40 repeat protein
MDLITLLSHDERRIVLTSAEDRSIITWNQSDTFQWWRPVVRMDDSDYPSGEFDPNDWEEVSILTQSGYGPKTYEDARQVAINWLTNSL